MYFRYDFRDHPIYNCVCIALHGEDYSQPRWTGIIVLLCIVDQLANLLLQAQRKAFYSDELLDMMTGTEELKGYTQTNFWHKFALTMTATIQQIIEFSKLTPGFVDLSQDDQIMVLKGGETGWQQCGPLSHNATNMTSSGSRLHCCENNWGRNCTKFWVFLQQGHVDQWDVRFQWGFFSF